MSNKKHVQTVINLFQDKLYSKQIFDNIPKNSIVYDIGFGIGLFTIYVLSLRHDLRVFAFEPSKIKAEFFNKNIVANNFGNNITLFRNAISNYDGKGTFSKHDNKCILIPDHDGHIDVKKLGNAAIIATKIPKFIRMNIQCAEYDTLLDARSIIINLHSTIIQYYNKIVIPDPKEYLEFYLDELNFEVKEGNQKYIYSTKRTINAIG